MRPLTRSRRNVVVFFKLIYLFIYFWLCWVFVSVRGLSLVAASGGHLSSWCAGLSLSRPLVAEHRLQTRRLSSCGSWAQLLRGMWDLPRPGLESVSPALAGGFSITAPPGKPEGMLFLRSILLMLGKCCSLRLSRYSCWWRRSGRCTMQIHDAQCGEKGGQKAGKDFYV